MTNQVNFVLNGNQVTIDDPSPDLLLIDYLRSPEVALTGAKKGCGQGGCGACTVILSTVDEPSGRVAHRAINSCLRPVCALGGLAVTTVEGTGGPARPAPAHLTHAGAFSRAAAPADYVAPVEVAARRSATEHRAAALVRGAVAGSEPVNRVAHRLAMNNGTQCGYCTTGFVMNMSAFLAGNPEPTKREVEEIFDGNICRCTGYRAILTGMKTFAVDWSADDEDKRMQCAPSADMAAQFHESGVSIPLDENSMPVPAPVDVRLGNRTWVTPRSIAELLAVLRDTDADRVRLVAGNTGFGVYPDEFLAADLLVDLRLVPELRGTTVAGNELRVGGAVTYTELIESLTGVLDAATRADGTRLGAVRLMARRTAGTIVRNAASLAGNTMLVLEHIAAGEPFPSDLLTALAGVDARVEFARARTDAARTDAQSGDRAELGIGELVAAVAADPAFLRGLVLLGYRVPLGDLAVDVVLAQKVAAREVNSHAIVNATTRLALAPGSTTVDAAVVVFGGIAPYPWRAPRTEAALVGRPLSLGDFPALAGILASEVADELELWRARLAGLPAEGITDAYRIDLAVGFLYKAVVNALLARDPDSVPDDVRSSGVSTWGRWPVSDGTQIFRTRPWTAPVGQPHINVMALYQATGRVHYTHEIALPPTAVNAAFVQSTRALADYVFVLPGAPGAVPRAELAAYLRERFASFVELITYEQLPPHGINLQGMGSDQPLFAESRVSYVGQALALVVAGSEQDAIAIAEFVSAQCVGYAPVDWTPPWDTPVLSLEDAIARDSVFPDCPASASFNSHVWRITRPGSTFGWVSDKDPLERTIVRRDADVDGLACTVVETSQRCGGQAHFYMETQAAVAVPLDGGRLLVAPSSQSPMEMHATTAMALGLRYHRIEVDVRQLGGAYGGKTEPARFVAGPAAVAAHVLDRPVRLVLKREHDTAMIGKRHAYYGQVQIAVDDGSATAADRGRIRGFHSSMWGDGGAFYDCSFIVSNCIQLRADNAYNVANFQNQIDVCRTNTAPNTAFRAFGDIQGKLLTENAIDDAAFALGLDAEAVREKNLYDRGDVTPFGQPLSFCYMKDVWAYVKTVSNYDAQRAAVDAFNAANTWRKRGIAIVPVKYGSGYNLVQLEQSAASVAVNQADGSIVIQQGGVEMGQGLLTVVEQVASFVLGVPMEFVHVAHPDTSVLPSPTSTGASTGTSYSAHAVKGACQELRRRLLEFGYRMREENGPAWCARSGIDFWNHGESGWAYENPATGKLVWQNLVAMAYAQRVSLVSGFSAPVHGGETPVPALTFKPMADQPQVPGIPVDTRANPAGAVDSFSGFTYSAACSVVEIDVLTGEVKVLSADVVYDAGWSMNPAIDIGQVEGAFVQGIGYVLCEELVYQPDGPDQGTLNSVNTWRYKPPATVTIPLRLNTYLFPRDSVNVPENPDEIFSAKEVGEPPLVLAASVFFAVKSAVRASRLERGLDGLFRLDAPATVQEVRRACAVVLDGTA